MSTDQCLWCRYSDDRELKGVIGIHVDDFLIGLADGALGEKWMSEIKSLYRWGSWKISESEFAGIRVRQHRDFSMKTTPTSSSLKLPSHVNDQDSDKNPRQLKNSLCCEVYLAQPLGELSKCLLSLLRM